MGVAGRDQMAISHGEPSSRGVFSDRKDVTAAAYRLVALWGLGGEERGQQFSPAQP